MQENPNVFSNSSASKETPTPFCRWLLRVQGIVQGVGFRPFVYNTARGLGLAGWVKNTSGQVEILLEGRREQLESFLQALRKQHPVQARIDRLELAQQMPAQPPLADFEIIPSSQEELVRPVIPADLALCAACRQEIHTPTERRYRYPFTNCTHCGPRWSIIRGLPYDRPQTSMAHFTMCPECRREYDNPADRRFHAQPIACPRCGPQLRLLVRVDGLQEVSSLADQPSPSPQEAQSSPSFPKYLPVAEGEAALQQTAQAILEGKIVALKGLGGFQLLCDATQQEVVEELRRRKHRPHKPFALMFPNLEAVRQACGVWEAEAQLLQSPESPIVLLPRREVLAEWASWAQTFPLPTPAETKPSPERLAGSPPTPLPRPESSGRPKAKPPEGPQTPLPSAGEASQQNWPAGGHRTAPSTALTSQGELEESNVFGWRIASAVAPGNPYLGVMLPYTPLHELLMEAVGRPIVCTSGNLSEEPMAYRTAEAIARLGQIADLILTHNRPIVRPVDDSVVRVVCLERQEAWPSGRASASGGNLRVSEGSGADVAPGRRPVVQVLRRARGYAPRPIELGFPMRPILALGGHLKNTVGLSVGTQAVLSQHVGDLDNLPSLELFYHTVEDLVQFFRVQPELVVCDLHPDYVSTQYAEQLARQWQVPLLRVQHHEAHLAACLAEQRFGQQELFAEPILGFCWDGTGYGWDGTIWGGEILLWQAGRVQRVGSIPSFPLPGGDQAMRQPRRSALGVLYELLGEQVWEKVAGVPEWFSPAEQAGLGSMLRRSVNSPRASSMGRLFDAVAALCGLGGWISFEGQAAMALEFAAMGGSETLAPSLPAYPLPWIERSEKTDPPEKTTGTLAETKPIPFGLLDWRPMLEAVLADRAAGVPVGKISRRFHAALANGILQAAQWAAHHWGVRRVALSGGCFQNALLTQLAYQQLHQAGFTVYLHQHVPPGDGGIALGQILLAVASAHLRES